MASFTTSETQEIKNRLGYGNLTASARPYFDIARLFEDIVQSYTDDHGIARTRALLAQLRVVDGGVTDTTGGSIMASLVRAGIKEIVGDVVFETGAMGGKTQLQSLLEVKEYLLCELEATLKVKRAPKLSGPSTVEVY